MLVQTLLPRIFPQCINFIKGFNSNNIVRRSLSNNVGVKPIVMVSSQYTDTNLREDKVPIIIMHGLFGSKTNWYSLGKAITRETRRKVLLVDARNHGDSPHTDEHSYYHLAEDIKYFMSENNINKAAVIGHSMGGRAMMALALQYPEKIESLTVVDISPIGTPKSMEHMTKIFEAMKNIKPTFGGSLSNARQIVEKQLRDVLGSQDLSSFLAMNLGSTVDGKFSWKINLKSIVKNYYPNITVFPIKEGNFSGPTIFVCGGNSDFVNFNDIDKIKQFFPQARFVEIQNAGHWVHAEQPKKFLEVVCSFINSIES